MQYRLWILSSFVFACASDVTGSQRGDLRVTGQGPPTAADMQYETGTSVQTFDGNPPPAPIVTVTYNDETYEVEQGFVTYPPGSRRAFPGYSNLGYSVSGDGGNSYYYTAPYKLRPPAYGQPGGWDALWGDPAITHSRMDQHFVYITSLAISDASFPLTTHTDKRTGFPGLGYVEGAVLWNGGSCTAPWCSYIDGACIARSMDAGQHFNDVMPSDCLSNNGHFYDGGSMDADTNGGVYAAFNDVTASAEDVWFAPDPGAMFSLITPGPFAGRQMVSHPRIRWDYQTGRLYVMALATPEYLLDDGRYRGHLLITYWNGSTWRAPVDLTSNALDYTTIQRGPILGNSGKVRTGVQFSFDVGTASVLGNDDIRIVYTSEEYTLGRAHLIGKVCSRDLSKCGSVGTSWTTINRPGEQFNPVVAAQPFFITVPAQWAVSYNSTEFAPNDSVDTTLSFMAAKLIVDSAGHHLPWQGTALVQNTPLCPSLNGQWGDYDDLRVLSISNNVTTFIRTHTDSTDSCTFRDAFDMSPIHVSAHTFQ